MTRAQLVTLWVGIVLAVAMAVYPPWREPVPGGTYVSSSYRPLFAPKKWTSLDTPRLLTQFGALGAVVAGMILTLRKKKE